MLLKPKPLTLKGVYASLRAIALTKGPGSAQRKQDLIKQLISRCRWVGRPDTDFGQASPVSVCLAADEPPS